MRRKAKIPDDVLAALDRLAVRVETWRRNRTRWEPMPNELWADIGKLSDEYADTVPLSAIAERLQISACDLKKHCSVRRKTVARANKKKTMHMPIRKRTAIGPTSAALSGMLLCSNCRFQIQILSNRNSGINRRCDLLQQLLGAAGRTPANCPFINQTAQKAQGVAYENRSICKRVSTHGACT